MHDGFIAKLGRGLGWVTVTIVGILLGILVALLPSTIFPGPLHTDFTNGRLVDAFALIYVAAMLLWRLLPFTRPVRFSLAASGRFLWLTVTAFALAFWPLGLAAWFNGWNSSSKTSHDMAIIAFTSTQVRSAITPIETFIAREAHTDWTADIHADEQRKRTFRVGDCVTITVRSGRLGLDWIEDAKLRQCP